MRVCSMLAILFFKTAMLHGQHQQVLTKQRVFQLSLAPGLGTNGTQPGSFNNYLSINLTSGYAASTLLFEIASISNLNINKSKGLQIAGMVNLTGGNAFAGLSKKQKDEKEKSGFTPYLSGWQISGLTNIVLGDADGAQFVGGINVVKGAHLGIQFSGITNIVYKYSMGIQIAGLFNVSQESFSGLQLSAFSNYTKGEMAGFQLTLLNHAGAIEGKNSYNNSPPTGIQIGLANFAKKMNGFQIGLINFAGQSQGTQIGLLNFYKGGKQFETKDGTAIGLLNFGQFNYAAVYTNEIFGFNYEVSTGTRKNSRIKLDNRNVYITNAIIYSHKSFSGAQWAFGYGLKKLSFNRSASPGMEESRFMGYGIDVQHINSETGKLTKHLNLLTRIKFLVGRRIAPKLFGVNWYASISFNALWSDEENSIEADFLSSSTEVKNVNLEYWPGLSLGILLH